MRAGGREVEFEVDEVEDVEEADEGLDEVVEDTRPLGELVVGSIFVFRQG